MAIASINPLVTSLRGMLGRDLVFKMLNGKFIVASRPRPSRSQTKKQRANRDKFRIASALARQTLLDPKKKLYYQEKAKRLVLPNAYTAAVAEFMKQLPGEANL